MNKKQIVKRIIIIAIILICIGMVAGYFIIKARKKEQERQEIFRGKRMGYGWDLYISFEWDDPLEYDEEKINSYLNVYEDNLYIRVAYYNYETGDDLTVDELVDAYWAFLKGDASGEDKLHKFDIFLHQDVYQVAERKIEDEILFRGEVWDALKDLYGDDMKIEDASKEELAKAVEAVVSR